MNFRRIALVSRNVHDVSDYRSCFSRVLQICGQQGADTVVFSMWSYDNTHTQLTHGDVFADATSVQMVLLECCNLRSRNECKTLVWRRERDNPQILYQRFARAVEPQGYIRAFLGDFESRRFGRDFVMLCGESNIVKIRMGTGLVSDEFGFLMRLEETGVVVILNPVHDYMVRHEMKKKRAALSSRNRWVLSVWNMGKKSATGKMIAEAHEPWTAFYNGEEVTKRIQEVKTAIPSVRLGVIEITL